jgi:hypothetical protein
MSEMKPTIKGKKNREPGRVFVYVISKVDARYRLTGCAPEKVTGQIFLGPCKVRMRPEVRDGDYIMGISPHGVGEHRRVLLWMREVESMSFAEAYYRGKSDPIFRAARGNTIHVKPRAREQYVRGYPDSYEHIPGAAHANRWSRDIEADRDVMFLGKDGSWIAEENGPPVDEELVALLTPGISWKGLPTIDNPLTENARGKHIRLEGRDAQGVVRWVSRHSPDAALKPHHKGRKRPLEPSCPVDRDCASIYCGLPAHEPGIETCKLIRNPRC